MHELVSKTVIKSQVDIHIFKVNSTFQFLLDLQSVWSTLSGNKLILSWFLHNVSLNFHVMLYLRHFFLQNLRKYYYGVAKISCKTSCKISCFITCTLYTIDTMYNATWEKKQTNKQQKKQNKDHGGVNQKNICIDIVHMYKKRYIWDTLLCYYG